MTCNGSMPAGTAESGGMTGALPLPFDKGGGTVAKVS